LQEEIERVDSGRAGERSILWQRPACLEGRALASLQGINDTQLETQTQVSQKAVTFVSER